MRKIRTEVPRSGYLKSSWVWVLLVVTLAFLANGCAVKERIEVSLGTLVAQEAQKYLGVPYRYGGRSPKGFDCSGLALHVYREYGVELPDASWKQVNAGWAVKRNELQPGDLLFFKSSKRGPVDHVGIYVGDGQFIHAPGRGRRVSLADLGNVYFREHFAAARRIFR